MLGYGSHTGEGRTFRCRAEAPPFRDCRALSKKAATERASPSEAPYVATTVSSAPKLMDARDAAKQLEASLAKPREPQTIADAAAASGLPLRDAERGLHWLTSEYRGHLRVTEEGELLFLYPTGFTKPWETRDALERGARAAWKLASGLARFVVRAWLTVVIFGYALLFLAVIIGLTLARQSNSSSNDSDVPSALGYVLFRVLADALFWTFHPFSPIAIGRQRAWGEDDSYQARREREAKPKDETPFYEKVNRFVFGPAPKPEEPLEMERRVLAEIRAQKGRIGLGDVMRVTGLPRDKADPMMARLMLDYEGDVDVSEGGGITYRFEALRKTTHDATAPRPAPAWSEPKVVPPLTGNPAGSNLLVAALNGFNLLMALYAIDTNLTLSRLSHLFDRVPEGMIPIPIPYDGVPIVLGLIPIVFSVAVFALPIARAALRPIQARRLARENGKLGLLREVLTRVETQAPLTEPALSEAWQKAAGSPPEPKELTRAVIELGGSADIKESGELRYRFVDLETEAEALEEERRTADEDEAKVGKVIFGSDR